MNEHAKLMVQRAQERAGVGWRLLGPELQRALIAREAVSLVLGQVPTTYEANPALAELARAAREALATVKG